MIRASVKLKRAMASKPCSKEEEGDDESQYPAVNTSKSFVPGGVHRTLENNEN